MMVSACRFRGTVSLDSIICLSPSLCCGNQVTSVAIKYFIMCLLREHTLHVTRKAGRISRNLLSDDLIRLTPPLHLDDNGNGRSRAFTQASIPCAIFLTEREHVFIHSFAFVLNV